MHLHNQKLFFLTIFTVFGFLLDGYAQETPDKFQCRVAVKFSGNDELKVLASSYINKSLRSLGDVTIVDDGALINISIVGLKNRTESGKALGYTLSVVITKRLNFHYLVDALKNKFDKRFIELAEEDTNNRYELIDHIIYTTSADSLKSTCEEIVAQIDSETIEKERKYYQYLLDVINKKK